MVWMRCSGVVKAVLDSHPRRRSDQMPSTLSSMTARRRPSIAATMPPGPAQRRSRSVAYHAAITGGVGSSASGAAASPSTVPAHVCLSLRAIGFAQDPTLGAVTLAFWANLRYNADDPRGALSLLDGALADRRRISSPRVTAMLHARAARAHSKAVPPK